MVEAAIHLETKTDAFEYKEVMDEAMFKFLVNNGD
jgi:hypothetical protein